MFAPSNPAASRRAPALGISLALHCLFVAWLVHTPDPRFVAPSSVVYGEHGRAIVALTWPNRHLDTMAAATPDTLPLDQTPPARITWQPPAKHAQRNKPDLPRAHAEPDPSTQAGPVSPAGSPAGSLSNGSVEGDEVRPALPVRASDPVVAPGDLAGVMEGDVVVEITIDEKGNIVEKVVLQTLSAVIDAKVLAALENWRFLPATRNGVAIPSKQDVHYHFKPRNG